jgi:hypothetical protein
MTALKVLSGHTTPETAYVVEDYPYGFRLRCKIRYWLEFKSSKGFRLVSQTTNPKLSGEVWNKPKASVYTMLAVMGLDEQGHVTWADCNMYEFDKLAEFAQQYGEFFDTNQSGVYSGAKHAYERYQALKVAAEERYQALKVAAKIRASATGRLTLSEPEIQNLPMPKGVSK